MKIAGYRKVNFKADDGVDVNGFTVYFFEDMSKQVKDDTRGCCFEKCFMTDKKYHDLEVNKVYEEQKDITLLYNRFGKLDRFI